jgi:hypothetical protein
MGRQAFFDLNLFQILLKPCSKEQGFASRQFELKVSGLVFYRNSEFMPTLPCIRQAILF